MSEPLKRSDPNTDDSLRRLGFVQWPHRPNCWTLPTDGIRDDMRVILADGVAIAKYGYWMACRPVSCPTIGDLVDLCRSNGIELQEVPQ